jgi:hypothetical protein
VSQTQSPASKFFESILVGTVDAIARAGAKAAESLAGDVKKTLRRKAAEAEMLEKGVEAWRKVRLGDIDDLPSELRDEPNQSKETRS